MHILILGAARKLAERLAQGAGLDGQAVHRLTLADVVAPTPPPGFAGTCDCLAVDLSAPGEAAGLASRRPDLAFPLAATASTWTAPGRCSTRSGSKGRTRNGGRGWCSLPPTPCSAARCPP